MRGLATSLPREASVKFCLRSLLREVAQGHARDLGCLAVSATGGGPRSGFR